MTPHLLDIIERSKSDYTIIAGSEVRELGMEIVRLEKAALLFKPIKGTPRPADIGKTVLFRHPPRSDGFVRYQASAYQQWMHAPDSYPVEWAELP